MELQDEHERAVLKLESSKHVEVHLEVPDISQYLRCLNIYVALFVLENLHLFLTKLQVLEKAVDRHSKHLVVLPLVSYQHLLFVLL